MKSRFLSFAKKGTKKKVSPSWTGRDQPVLGVDQLLLRTALNHSWLESPQKLPMTKIILETKLISMGQDRAVLVEDQ